MGWLSQTTLQGVGTIKLQLLQNRNLNLEKNASPRDSLGLLTIKEIDEEEGVLLPQVGRLFLSVLRPQTGNTSPCFGENLQKSAS
jgi:hypothetical protein